MRGAAALGSAAKRAGRALTMQDTLSGSRRRTATPRQRIAMAGMPTRRQNSGSRRCATVERAGLMSQADALEKGALEAAEDAELAAGKDNAETLAKHLDAMKFLAGGVMANPDPR